MKAIVVCPAERPQVAALAQSTPLVNVPVFGKGVLEHWLDHLAAHGAREVLVLAADRPDRVRARVGDGARWGLRIEVFPESRELTAEEARTRYLTDPSANQPAESAPISPTLSPSDGARNFQSVPPSLSPSDGESDLQSVPPSLSPSDGERARERGEVIVADHLPGAPQFPLFSSYESWYAALRNWIQFACTPDRVGVREIQPGIWAGLHSEVASGAELIAPCWIGQDVRVETDAVIGPGAMIEDGVWIERGAAITESYVGPKTLVGELTQVHQSLAWDRWLINWPTNSALRVPDPFLLCGLEAPNLSFLLSRAAGRLAALAAMLLTFPIALYGFVQCRRQGKTPWRPRRAVKPFASHDPADLPETITYYELAHFTGLMRRWPQLCNIARGEFCWVGNPPLTPADAAALQTEAERLCLAVPTGMISLADTAPDAGDDELLGHAIYYPAHQSWRLDCEILAQVFLGRAFQYARRPAPHRSASWAATVASARPVLSPIKKP